MNNSKLVDNEIHLFLTTIGRGKFIKPIYSELKKQGRLEFALKIYNEAKDFYHGLMVRVLKNLLSS